MLAKLSCFGIVCGFSLVNRKTDIKNSSLENTVNYFDINKYGKELSSSFLRDNVELPTGTRICDYGKTLEGFP